MLEVIIDNRDGTMWDVSQLIPDLSWKTSRVGKPSSLEFTLVKDSPYMHKRFKCSNGDVVRVRKDGFNLFYGYIFSNEEGPEQELKLTAYDQIRYLSETDTYVKTNVTADQVIRDNATELKLRIGELAKTQYAIPKMMQDGQKRIDTICKALDETLLNKNRMYVFYDDFGSLMLRDINDMTVNLVLGDNSLVYGYNIKRSIDDETYNRMKFVQDNKEDGDRKVYITQDSASMARWGRLQYYHKADSKLNKEQIVQMMDRMMTLKNREQRTFSIEALGFPGMRAGVKVQITISKLKLNQYFLVEECTHSFSGGEHTMKLDLRIY